MTVYSAEQSTILLSLAHFVWVFICCVVLVFLFLLGGWEELGWFGFVVFYICPLCLCVSVCVCFLSVCVRVCSHNQLGLVKSDLSGHAHKMSSQPQQWRQSNLVTTDVMIPTAHRALPPVNLSTHNRWSSGSLQAPSALVQTTQWVPVLTLCVCVCVYLVRV